MSQEDGDDYDEWAEGPEEQNNDIDDVDEVYNEIVVNRNNRLEGKVNAIPFAGKPNFSSVIPGLMHGRYYLIAGPQKSGKTSYTDDTFLFEPLNWIHAHPDAGISIKVFYFTLEMSKKEKILSVMARLLFKKYGIVISSEDLMSYFTGETPEEGILPQEDLERLETVLPDVKIMLQSVEFIEDTKNPYGIFKKVEGYMHEIGTFTYKEIDFGGETGVKRVKDKYIRNDPDHYVLMITDHISLLHPERELRDIRQIITKFSSNDCITLRNRYGVSICNVQQMSSASQTKEFHNGSSVVEKLKPDATSLGENKTTSRDCNVMISIFNPYIYGIPSNNGYNILNTDTGLRDHYREVIINLNRHGRSNVSIDMFFNGAIGAFKELPPPDHSDMNIVYDYARQLDS